MKNYDELTDGLLERRDHYVAEQKRKKRRALGITTSLCCFCTVALLSLGMWQDNVAVNGPQSENNSNTVAVDGKNQIAISLFPASEKSSDTDAFGEDEHRHIDVILQGNRRYIQLEKSFFTNYGINNLTLSESDFGEKIGIITEIGPETSALSTPCSQEPNLSGCEVYRYSPVGSEAIIVVKGNGHCSLFAFEYFTEQGHSMNEKYAIYSVFSAVDIVSLNYDIIRYENTNIKVKSGTITERADIRNFYEITKALTPYKNESNLSGDPAWMTEARAIYWAEDNIDNRYNVEITITLKNNISFKLAYTPNLGTGYFDGHKFLSAEQNQMLKDMFRLN